MANMVIEQQWSEAIRQELRDRGMTMADFAALLGVTQPTVSVYLSGKKKPGPDVIERWLSVLGLECSLQITKVPA